MKDSFFILIRKENSNYHIRIKNNDLLYLQAKGDYVEVQTTKERYITHSTLKALTERLQHLVYRNHRSYSVNLSNIEIVNDDDVFVGKYEIPIGEEYKKPLLELLYK